ncbi:gliding motility-associated lipoprotein GldJ [Mucilaginibacter gracilis]|uniref:Gliding motility-associated lipoprotein GldJ n=1 Tax=Mucilaginibacter gracilis TaxID=423350 RepID=A0A495IXN0_9SPHI|nr:SUMF1/EgtB/PvdO family nonheme iron enzyme [Mucilaginibacter gracilis]RKR80828.1 gliding motility-associated lipoprotein GldJ [Mucilaginibacter gracilis]
MKIILRGRALTFVGICLIFCSCKHVQRSEKTGWKYNDKTNGGFQVFKKKHPAPGPGLIPIEGGTFVEGGSADQDVQYDLVDKQRRSIASFYMDETEVSNSNWLEYLHWIKTHYPEDREAYYNALPDTLVWRRPLSANEPYVNSYFRHTAFQDYPVVGVTWEQANDYCDWRTDAVNEGILRETGRIADFKTASNDGAKVVPAFNTELYLNNQIRGKDVDGKRMPLDLSVGAKAGEDGKARRPVRAEDGILKGHYRLPSEAEWEYAALGVVAKDENIVEGKMYPWSGMGLRSPKRQTQGLILANFKRGMGDYSGVAGSLNDKADITAPVRSYLPNDFGLYNMAGNVNEWTADTYRQLRGEDDDMNPIRGNEFVNTRTDPKTGTIIVDKNGHPIHDPAKSGSKTPYALTLTEQNQTKTADQTGPGTKYPSSIDGKPYNPDQRGYNDTVNNLLYGRTTLVNDRSKVYKGGSWNDMAYWLNPATRRFMDQAAASADVGFRCAMTMEDQAEIHPEGKPHFPVKKAPVYIPK